MLYEDDRGTSGKSDLASFLDSYPNSYDCRRIDDYVPSYIWGIKVTAEIKAYPAWFSNSIDIRLNVEADVGEYLKRERHPYSQYDETEYILKQAHRIVEDATKEFVEQMYKDAQEQMEYLGQYNRDLDEGVKLEIRCDYHYSF